MSITNFFTPISFSHRNKTFQESLLEKVDRALYFGGKKATILAGRTENGVAKAILEDGHLSQVEKVGKIALYCIIFVIPAALLLAKVALRFSHNLDNFTVVDPGAEVEAGIDTFWMEGSIANLSNDILCARNNDGIRWLSRYDERNFVKSSRYLVFELPQHPGFIFKIVHPGITLLGRGYWVPTGLFHNNTGTERLFENIVKAKKICLLNGLNLLVTPQAKIVTVNYENTPYKFIVEKKMEFEEDAHSQNAIKELFFKYSRNLNEAFRQYATFLALTSFGRVIEKHFPIKKENPDFQGHRSFCLINLMAMESRDRGFVGGGRSYSGLIECATSEDQIDLILAEGCSRGACSPELAQERKEHALEKLRWNDGLRDFYHRQGIKTGVEPINVQFEELELDLSLKVKTTSHKNVALRDVAELIVNRINQTIQARSEEHRLTRREIRSVFFDISRDLFEYFPLERDKDYINTTREEEKAHIWVFRIFKALQAKGYIYSHKFDFGFHVQA